jgi:hypothetical protein
MVGWLLLPLSRIWLLRCMLSCFTPESPGYKPCPRSGKSLGKERQLTRQLSGLPEKQSVHRQALQLRLCVCENVRVKWYSCITHLLCMASLCQALHCLCQGLKWNTTGQQADHKCGQISCHSRTLSPVDGEEGENLPWQLIEHHVLCCLLAASLSCVLALAYPGCQPQSVHIAHALGAGGIAPPFGGISRQLMMACWA